MKQSLKDRAQMAFAMAKERNDCVALGYISWPVWINDSNAMIQKAESRLRRKAPPRRDRRYDSEHDRSMRKTYYWFFRSERKDRVAWYWPRPILRNLFPRWKESCNRRAMEQTRKAWQKINAPLPLPS